MLALETHPAHRHPDQRMEPQQRQRKLRHKLRERVKALHVRELVRQHGDPLFFVPLRGGRRQQNHGIDDPPRHRDVGLGVLEEHDWTLDAVLA